jgi:xanthine dehydrogenase accessory factor
MSAELSGRAAALRAGRVPFVLASVVRAQRPTSVRPGDVAVVLGDGAIEGFVGGACAEQSVRLHALRALETEEAMLLRILPGDGDAPASEGAVTVQNPCLSGGALEIFLEPVLPAPRMVVLGGTPIARALARLAPEVGLEVAAASGEDAGGPASQAGDLALVVASHGRDELEALGAALELGVPYVGLVASGVRGAAVLADLVAAGTAPERAAAIETPAGLDIGARTAEEIALSILARIVAVRRSAATATAAGATGAGATPAAPAPATAVDPVCGMTVVLMASTPQVEHEGRLVAFCCEGCRASFERDPARFAAVG